MSLTFTLEKIEQKVMRHSFIPKSWKVNRCDAWTRRAGNKNFRRFITEVRDEPGLMFVWVFLAHGEKTSITD